MYRQIRKYLVFVSILFLTLYFCPGTSAKDNGTPRGVSHCGQNLTSGESTNHIVAGMTETRNALRKITSGLPSEKRQRSNKTALYYIGMPGYNRYRIPSLIVTKQGTLLAFCEGRSAGDTGDIDTLVRRSEDDGTTCPILPFFVSRASRPRITGKMPATRGKIDQVVWSDGNNTCGLFVLRVVFCVLSVF
jgi:hypothetical protein